MKTFYLKHDNEVQFLAALENSDVIFYYIGLIHKSISDDEYETIEGFHANVLSEELPDELKQFEVAKPNNPVQEFFI